MSDNGKNGKQHGKPREMALTHKGVLAPKALAEHCFKPGKSGNPTGKKKKKKLGLAEYLEQFFDEMHTRTRNGITETVPRAQMLAEIIAIEAMQGSQPAVRRECLRICVDMLWPIPKDPQPLFQYSEYHTHRTVGFFADLEKMTGGAPVTPEMLLEAYRKDFAGEFIDVEISDAEEGENETPPTEHDTPT